MAKPAYTAHARVEGGRDGGRGSTSGGELDVRLALPKELGGDGDGVNPEQLFAVGWAACFEAVLGLVGKKEGVEAGDAVIDAAVSLVPAGGGRFVLAAELDVTLPSIADAAAAQELVRTAHGLCPYSTATRGNIDVAFTVNGVALS
ncbi:Ohr family peroxiredoxin [Phytomonospora endophytica]|uniref:Ohr subfamily peroxiredoxin n=1 Tax=Phytomonospora endophytica TaxID=714109 RepID=A0A841FZN1_9ACTN|nr:Ohr family peroxiredoxin [Phytomonospora endophytica]MBB6038982.1 Ohr subfamily peroxiredoxin [Phytomonospora endophytica]GIG67914.1 putative organic hydroperoxide resistance protein/OsmC-like protein [Phytomonospora endophytica]